MLLYWLKARRDCSKGTGEQGGRAATAGTATRSPSNARLRYKSTEILAVRVVPLYEAEIAAEVETRTIDVLTVKVALVAPAGINTLEGTLAAPLLLESVTLAPPAGAAPLSLTVPVEDCVPPTTLVGFRLSDERVAGGGGAGVTVSEVVLARPA
jgi:hypothetical protein